MDFVPHPSLRSSPNTSGGDCEDDELNGASDSGTNKWLNNHHPFSIVLMPHSLLIFKDDAYSSECLIDTVLLVRLIFSSSFLTEKSERLIALQVIYMA